ncbi:hypothetical protein AAAC51_02645 [Priestia megaterium]
MQKDYVADFTVLERDLFEISADDIPGVQVQMTAINGEIVYQNKKRPRALFIIETYA